MKTINIKVENNNKFINNRTLDEIMKDFNSFDSEFNVIKNLFLKISTEEDLIMELRLIKKNHTPAEILFFIKILGNISISEANHIFEEVFEG
ncbi:hypothetical protein [Flavobacterium covae]|uniref:hypothetical protein n=1 Tax=Flavobacterium covae TaxID=2906076 RepID=UPI001FB78377|nr:hypothetical protein [Flavobacterium covae]MCJ1806238.1 hypothetical protein [Flavobacterium covae]